MTQEKVYPVSKTASSNSHLNRETYEKLYRESIESPEKFWAGQAEELLSWHKPWKVVKQGDFRDASSEWFSEAKLNVSYNLSLIHI